jgi:hypothetical protein
MTGNSYTVFNTLVDIVASPGKALDEIRQHTSWLWLPLLSSILLAAGLFAYYYSWVDFPWLVEDTIRQLPAETRAEAAGPVRQFMQPGRTMSMAIIAAVIVSLLIYTIQAAYLHLANKLVTGADIGFGQWFSLSVWAGFVSVFGTLAGFATILMADSNQLATQDLAALSINSLLVHASPGEPWFRWASSLTLVNFWTLFLMSIGIARWTGAGMMRSTIIAILPWLLIFGIWATMI